MVTTPTNPLKDELVEALQDAVVVLGLEFADTEGSGKLVLRKCEKALQALLSERAADSVSSGQSV